MMVRDYDYYCIIERAYKHCMAMNTAVLRGAPQPNFILEV